MRIYTKTGDTGTTALFAGGRVRKDDLRVDAYGSVDETNAALGLARTAAGAQQEALSVILARIQEEMFDAGADLADPRAVPNSKERPPRIEAGHVERLELEIDQFEAEIEPLRNFILPGGGELGARLHLCRTIARRAERLAVALAAAAVINPEVVRYLNRLSDHLFVMARVANAREGVGDITWQS